MLAGIAFGCFGLVGCSERPFQPGPPAACVNNPFRVSEATWPTWSPDGSKIAFLGSRDSSGAFARGIYVIDTLGSPRRKLFDASASYLFVPSEVAWSPDGTMIAFAYADDIWTVDVATGAAVIRTASDRGIFGPSWSPDSRHIVYWRETDPAGPSTTGGLYILDVADGSIRPLQHDGIPTSSRCAARFSPDGRQIAMSWELPYVPDELTPWEIFLINVDGTGYRRLTYLNGTANNPQWSVDGSKLFIDFSPCLEVGAPARVTMVVDPASGRANYWPTMLGDSRVQFGYNFALSPDGRRIVYTGLDNSGTMGVLRMKDLEGRYDRQLTQPVSLGPPPDGWPMASGAEHSVAVGAIHRPR